MAAAARHSSISLLRRWGSSSFATQPKPRAQPTTPVSSEEKRSTLGGDNAQQFLRTERIQFMSGAGEAVVDAVIQDTMPQGSPHGTVVAIHGAPGSHKDFKYMAPYLSDRGIRLVGVNFPGFGITVPPVSPQLTYDNVERLNYVQSVVDHLGLTRDVVFIGHSRGSENALRMGVVNEARTRGIILCNPVGLRVNRGVRPFWLITSIDYLWNLGAFFQFFLRPFLYWYYTNILKFKTPPGESAVTSVLTMGTVDFPSQLPFIERLNETEIPVLIAYAGKDPLLEVPVLEEFVDAFRDAKRLHCDDDHRPESATFEEFARCLRAGDKRVAVLFEKNDHFLQKFRAKFLVDVIHAMLQRK